MGKFRPNFRASIRPGLSTDEQQLSIYYRIHALGYSTEMEERKVVDNPVL
jgi:hypothetical protein